MGRVALIRVAGVSALALLAAGCGEKAETGLDGTTAAAERPASGRLVERDVEAPEIFSVTEEGLWDGRPSLGGVWVAHPDVDDPERVIIRNEANGKFVIGALFKRERENPGPRLQVSSDAASAIGLIAGAPQRLNVTALRRQDEAPASAGDAVAAIPEPGAVATTSLDLPDAEAAIERAEGTTSAVPGSTSVAAAPQPAAEPARTRRSWNPFRRKSAPEAVAVSAPATVLPASVAGAEPAPEAARPPQTASAPASELGRPYVQIGIFSVKENADNTATAMRANGMVPDVLEQQSQGATFWRVVVGPAASETDRSAILDKVKDLGFTDAYYVSG
ncbi:SPOR domain-containing protein [Tropicimonas sp. IMCC34011]|uniref:SPOR domain-containing protein n=1 Tax=Tropicimonas sp. IMCC34011 TaxID=2248759 RepID=UPI000E27CE2E|nr:SPOR domain-containing protein [Tropicimonas sp. IMCC34011]